MSINPEIELTFTVIDAQKEFNEDDDEICEGKKYFSGPTVLFSLEHKIFF